jgi:hypothetical protein
MQEILMNTHVTWSNEMIEDLIDFIEIHPIVAFEAIYEPMLTSFWSLISFAVQLYIIMQYKGQHPPLLPKQGFCLLIGQSKFHPSWKKNRMHFYFIQIRSIFFIQVSCMVYTINQHTWIQETWMEIWMQNNNYVLCKDGGKRGNSKMQEKDSHME